MKRLLFTLAFLTIVHLLSAHEFWLQPDKYIYERGETINIRFRVGENFEGENWTGDTSKVNSLDLYYGGVQDDLTPALGTEKGDSIQLAVLDEGTHMVTFNSRNSTISLDAAKFNEYLSEDGLDETIAWREANHQTDSAGHEFYQRSVKTLFQVGKDLTNTFKEPTSLPLDIILQKNPYAITDSQLVSAKIFFRQQPLEKSLIKIWHRDKGITTKTETLTNVEGEITFPVSASGEWMISTVKMIKAPDQPIDTDNNPRWQSYWGSCTWGYQ